MNKTMKIVSILLMIMMLTFTLSTVVMAGSAVTDVLDDMGKIDTSKAEGVSKIGGEIASILTTVGIVVAVIVLLILGIKYMMGSASEKAEYKKTMIPYLIGAVLVLGASSIVKILFSTLNIAG